MRRKKDDKRVLRAGNGSSTRNNRNRFRSRNNRFKSNNNRFKSSNDRFKSSNRNSASYRNQKKKKKRSGKTVLIMIIALVAFIVGAGIGISMSFDDGSADNATHIENVTVEMTTNLNDTEAVIFDEADDVDYNENQTDVVLRDENKVYYDNYDEYSSY